MSINSKIELETINYVYNTHTFVSSGETITGTKDDPIKINALVKDYTGIFEKGKNDLGELEKLLTGIVGTTFYVKDEQKDVTIDNIIKYTSDFYASAKTINSKFIDENCLEGYRAYSFYLEKIILLLNKLNDAIKQGQDAIKEIETLDPQYMAANQTVEEYVNGKVHELSAELYLADQAIADVKAEFESCLKYNADTKSWDKSSYKDTQLNNITRSDNELKIDVKDNDKDSGLNLTFNHLRGLEVDITDTGKDSPTHQIACFSELNLLDRLRYIRYYYEIVLGGNDSDYQVFPDDPEKGYPCVPDVKSNTDTKATESMGGFELFYVGYLVDRDGSIDAYSSCLEAKSKAITDNISLQSEHIEAYNQYLAFINRAAQLLNESQSEKTAAIPHGAHLGLTYFCGGTMRDLLEVDGVNYIVLSYTDKDGSRDELKPNSDFNYGYNHRYLLVRADEKGLKALYNTETKKDPNGSDKELEVITAGGLEVLFTQSDNNVTYDCQLKDNSEKNFGYPDTIFYRRAHSSYYPIVSSSEDNREILIWDMVPDTEDILNKEAQNKYQKNYDKLSDNEKKEVEKEVKEVKEVIGISRAEKYLPKQLIIQEIEPDSVAAYDKYNNYSTGGWGYDNDGKESAEEANRVINSWTTAFSNKSEYINTAIETINTDITALRTKMDTIDSLCSTLRNRSFETKKTLVSNLRS